MCFIDLNVRAKMMKLLEENKNICDLGLGNSFLDMISKAQAMTKKIDKLSFIIWN